MISRELELLPTVNPVQLTPVQLTSEQYEAIQAGLNAARSPATRLAYRASWRLWEKWCAEQGYQALPAESLHVAAYLAGRGRKGSSASTLTKDVAAIRAAHLDSGHLDPTTTAGVRQLMAGLRRTIGVAPSKQAHPLTTGEIKRILGGIDRGSLRGKRDAAMLLLGYSAALRRSELVALRVSDLVVKADGLVATVRRSKKDQEGVGAVVGVRRGEHPETDPVAAVLVLIKAGGLSVGDPLFQGIAWSDRRVNGRPLTGTAVNLILTERASAVGLGDLPISGHSLRAGHATTAAEAGVPAERLARTTRHASLASLARYVRPGQVLADTSSGSLGL